jgi:hypothetical protein
LDGAATDKIGRRYTIFVASVLDLTTAEVKVKDGDRIRVLVRDNQILP